MPDIEMKVLIISKHNAVVYDYLSNLFLLFQNFIIKEDNFLFSLQIRILIHLLNLKSSI